MGRSIQKLRAPLLLIPVNYLIGQLSLFPPNPTSNLFGDGLLNDGLMNLLSKYRKAPKGSQIMQHSLTEEK